MSAAAPITETFDLTLPAYAVRLNRGADYAYLSSAQQTAYSATSKARVVTAIALVQAISPELAALTPYTGGWTELFSFRFDGGPSLSFRDLLKTGQLEVRVERYSRTHAFRRVKVDPKTGAIDPRFVEVVRELVKEALDLVTYETAAQVRAASAAEAKAAAFTHASAVVASTGLDWAYGGPHNHEGTVNLNREHSYSARIVGHAMKVELSGVDVDHLPALLAFVKTLSRSDSREAV